METCKEWNYRDHWPKYGLDMRTVEAAFENGADLFLIGSHGGFGCGFSMVHGDEAEARKDLDELNKSGKSHYGIYKLSVTTTRETTTIENLRIDHESRSIYINGEEVYFTPGQFKILTVLFRNKNTVVTREKLMKEVWEGTSVHPNNIDTHMSHIRSKLKNFNGKIKTLKSLGYIVRTK